MYLVVGAVAAASVAATVLVWRLAGQPEPDLKRTVRDGDAEVDRTVIRQTQAPTLTAVVEDAARGRRAAVDAKIDVDAVLGATEQRPDETEAIHGVRLYLLEQFSRFFEASRMPKQRQEAFLRLIADAQENYAIAWQEYVIAHDAMDEVGGIKEVKGMLADEFGRELEAFLTPDEMLHLKQFFINWKSLLFMAGEARPVPLR